MLAKITKSYTFTAHPFCLHTAPLRDPEVIIQRCNHNNVTKTEATVNFILHEMTPTESIEIHLTLRQCSGFPDDKEVQGKKLGYKFQVTVSDLRANTTYCYTGIAFNTSSQENISEPCIGNFTTTVLRDDRKEGKFQLQFCKEQLKASNFILSLVYPARRKST